MRHDHQPRIANQFLSFGDPIDDRSVLKGPLIGRNDRRIAAQVLALELPLATE